MTPLIERFHAHHPHLRVEFVMSDRYLDLSKGEADVAFRSGDTEDELVGRKIADSIWAIYASRDYIERHGKPQHLEELSRHPLVCLDESMSNHRVAKWLKAAAPEAKITARNTSVLGLMYAVKSGVGVARCRRQLPIPKLILCGCWGQFRSLPEAGGCSCIRTFAARRASRRFSTLSSANAMR